jgi:hypothetical protein
MGKIGCILVFLIVLIGGMFLIPNSPVYRLATDYALKKMETRWGCEVVRNRVYANPLRGTLTLSDLLIKTSEQANPNWRLEIKTAALKIGYLSFIRSNSIDSLFLDGIVFKQETRKSGRAESFGKKDAPAAASKKTVSGTSRAKNTIPPEKIRIKRLQIRNGSFEYIRIDASGVKNSTQANQISIVRKDILLVNSPDKFFGSLLSTHTKF